MKNHEKYKRAAGLVRPSTQMNILNYVEEKTMKKNRRPLRTFAVACGAVVLAMALAVGAYAADVGGFRQTVNLWLHGDITEVTIEQIGEGQFEVTYPDGSTRGTGGAVEDGHGGMRPATMEEVKEYLLTEPDVNEDEDGRIWLYLRDNKIELTDQIQEKGYAQVKVKDGLLADYITVVWGEDGLEGIYSSRSGFDDPEEFM